MFHIQIAFLKHIFLLSFWGNDLNYYFLAIKNVAMNAIIISTKLNSYAFPTAGL